MPLTRTKHTFRLREGDIEFLRDQFPAQGANYVVQKLISDFVDKVQKQKPSEDELAELIEELADGETT